MLKSNYSIEGGASWPFLHILDKKISFKISFQDLNLHLPGCSWRESLTAVVIWSPPVMPVEEEQRSILFSTARKPSLPWSLVSLINISGDFSTLLQLSTLSSSLPVFLTRHWTCSKLTAFPPYQPLSKNYFLSFSYVSFLTKSFIADLIWMKTVLLIVFNTTLWYRGGSRYQGVL